MTALLAAAGPETGPPCSPVVYSMYHNAVLGPLVCPCQSAFNQRNRTSKTYIWRDVLHGTGWCGCGCWVSKSEICRAGHPEGQAEATVHSGPFFSLGEPQWGSEGLSTDLIRPTHITQDNLPYLKSTDLGLESHLLNTFIVLSGSTWLSNLACSLAKLIGKEDHHTASGP